MIGVAGPVFGLFRIFVPDQEFHGRFFRNRLDMLFEIRLQRRTNHEELVVGITANHVSIQIDRDRCGIDRRTLHEGLRSAQPGFFGIECGEQQRISCLVR